MKRRWRIHPPAEGSARWLADKLEIHPLLATLMVNRGVDDLEPARGFLARRLSGLHDPALLPDMAAAADLIYERAKAGRKICIYGDYDVDGMCATAILLECFRAASVPVRFFVPDRMEDGYGLNSRALNRLAEDGIDTVITVDCGISALEQARTARELGIELIITDHHEFAETLPDAAAIIHPRRDGSSYPWGGLCGAGVAYKLAWEIARRFTGATKVAQHFQRFLLDATALAAIGTVCDMVPLADENRLIVHHGLSALKAQPAAGLGQLLATAKLDTRSRINAEDVAFQLGPRLNACGRLGHARLGVELLTTRDLKRAAELARYLSEENSRRQTIERRTFQEARDRAAGLYDLDDPNDARPIVLDSAEWHPGVIGIVASRMVERYHRPCIMLAIREGRASGSGRSVPGFHLQQALAACSDLLHRSGGHAAAAGLSLDVTNIEAFRERFHQFAEDCRPGMERVGELTVDAEAPLAVFSAHVIREMTRIEPFGIGNPAPLFLATGLNISGEVKRIGGGDRHLSFHVEQGGRRYRAVAWSQAERAEELTSDGGRLCAVFRPIINEFNGMTRVEIEIKDFRPGASVADLELTAQPAAAEAAPMPLAESRPSLVPAGNRRAPSEELSPPRVR